MPVTLPATERVSAPTWVYVSNADSQEIRVLRLDESSGRVEPVAQVQTGGMVMPLAVSPDRRFLYAGIRSQPYAVQAYAIDAASGRLELLATAPLPDSMAYVSTDRSGRFLLAASYGGGLVSVSPIDGDGAVRQAAASVLKTGRNAHSIVAAPGNRFVCSTSLGDDRVHLFTFDAATGALTPNVQAWASSAPGAGPRHLVFHPQGRWVFVTNELDATVASYAYDAQQGRLSPAGTASLLPDGFVKTAQLAAADLHLTPDGHFLYASDRSSDTLTGFRVDAATGALTRVTQVLTEKQPRGFNIDPDGRWLLAAGQQSNALTVYAIDPASGALDARQRVDLGRNPNWIEIIRS